MTLVHVEVVRNTKAAVAVKVNCQGWQKGPLALVKVVKKLVFALPRQCGQKSQPHKLHFPSGCLTKSSIFSVYGWRTIFSLAIILYILFGCAVHFPSLCDQ